MTAVPKPLKFLRPHYESLEKAYESWPAGEEKDSLADTLSVLGMTYSDEERLDTLKYRLLAPSKDLGSWGHEYMRHLALEIGQEYQKRLEEDKDYKDLTQLALSLIPFFLSHNAEADAVDILSELEMIEQIKDYLDENTYARVCLYMSRSVEGKTLKPSAVTKYASAAWYPCSPTPTTIASSAQRMTSTTSMVKPHKPSRSPYA